MSTEKDREAIQNHAMDLDRVAVCNSCKQSNEVRAMRSFEAGIQHARQGEKELLRKFAVAVVVQLATGKIGAVNLDNSVFGDKFIDEFLEQEKSK